MSADEKLLTELERQERIDDLERFRARVQESVAPDKAHATDTELLARIAEFDGYVDEAARLMWKCNELAAALEYLVKTQCAEVRAVIIAQDGDDTEYMPDPKAVELFGEENLIFQVGCGSRQSYYSLKWQDSHAARILAAHDAEVERRVLERIQGCCPQQSLDPSDIWWNKALFAWSENIKCEFAPKGELLPPATAEQLAAQFDAACEPATDEVAPDETCHFGGSKEADHE